MSIRTLVETFERWRGEGRDLVLATVAETAGSTYSKPGHRILIAADGTYQGLISGGCLEGDLAAHAAAVLADGQPKLVTYDLRGEADGVFGLGIGCEGLIRVLLQKLDAAHDHQPFADIAAIHRGLKPAIAVVVLEPGSGGPPTGGTVSLRDGVTRAHGLAEVKLQALADAARGPGTLPRLATVGGARVLVAPVEPIPRLLVLGGGPDAVPLVAIASQVGWRVTVFDHRPANLARGDFGAAEAVHCAPAAELGRTLGPGDFHAALLMSHHQATDREYLRELARHPVPYVGLLGPRARRERLLGELGADAGNLGARLRGPAGLDIGARSPESIALAIVAELEATRAGRAGGPLPAGEQRSP